MQRGQGETLSIWRQLDRQEPQLPLLLEDIQTDVCVVGAGIAGLTTAHLLQKEGLSVAVLDSWGLASGETGRTTAHLTAVLDDRFFHLESLFGEAKTRLAAESHMAAINRIEDIVREEDIKCDFERLDGYLVALTEKQKKDFEKEREPAKRAGFADVEEHSLVPLPETQDLKPALRFPQQATFHIARYMFGLADAFLKNGGKIYTGAHVRTVKGGDQAYIKTDDGFRVQAKHIVVATNTPINDWVKMHTKQAAYRTYVVAFEIPKNAYPPFLLWDMEDPYHYVRILHGDTNDFLVVGGEDHKTGQAADMNKRYKQLEDWAGRYFLTLGPVRYRWSGQVMEPVDSLAFIGRNPGDEENIYIATGDSGNGITHGTIAGILISDLIQGRANPWQELYDPARKTLKAGMEFTRENVNVAGEMIKNWVKPGAVKDVQNIPKGEGAVLRDGPSKIAVYRDEQGVLHSCSAVCTHLNCIVQWNSGEKSWDCPCHGSRFDCEGRILNGPAIKPLARVNIEADLEKFAG